MAFERKVDSGDGDSIKFVNPGDSVTGVYVGAQDFPEGKFGPAVKHIFKTETGVKVVFAKPESQISNLLAGEAGKLVRLTYERNKPSGKGNPTKIYTLDVDADYVPTDAELTMDEPAEDDDTSADSTPVAAQPRTPTAPIKGGLKGVLAGRRTN